ncbi:hypothetical protein K1719_016690 [Acacia pycnantha]|nr:hypothetical protein K1719_016690 [Acacia pycnantha]
MYDATVVRLQAGRQAEVLNQIVYELHVEDPLAESRPVRELLGLTRVAVQKFKLPFCDVLNISMSKGSVKKEHERPQKMPSGMELEATISFIVGRTDPDSSYTFHSAL